MQRCSSAVAAPNHPYTEGCSRPCRQWGRANLRVIPGQCPSPHFDAGCVSVSDAPMRCRPATRPVGMGASRHQAHALSSPRELAPRRRWGCRGMIARSTKRQRRVPRAWQRLAPRPPAGAARVSISRSRWARRSASWGIGFRGSRRSRVRSMRIVRLDRARSALQPRLARTDGRHCDRCAARYNGVPGPILPSLDPIVSRSAPAWRNRREL